MYLNLTETAYQLQQFDKTIQFGEKALTYKEIETQNKLRMYLYLANAYNLTKKDIDKAYSYADLVIELAKSVSSEGKTNVTIDTNFIAPALRIQVQILLSKPQELNNTIAAFNKALEAYKLDKSEKSANFVLVLSERMVKKNQVEDAIKGVEILSQAKPNADYAKLLAFWYERLGNRVKAIENLKASYQMKKNPKVAYDLGVLLNKTDIDSAMNYLAEAHLLNDEKYSPKALELLQHLFFNVYVKAKGLLPADQEKGFQEILNAAKANLGITTS
jgi:tetratricopeptide (TPR) repeat protein